MNKSSVSSCSGVFPSQGSNTVSLTPKHAKQHVEIGLSEACQAVFIGTRKLADFVFAHQLGQVLQLASGRLDSRTSISERQGLLPSAFVSGPCLQLLKLALQVALLSIPTDTSVQNEKALLTLDASANQSLNFREGNAHLTSHLRRV